MRSVLNSVFRFGSTSVLFFDSTERKGMEKSFELSITREPEANNLIRKESGSMCLRSSFFSSFRSTRETSFFVPRQNRDAH